MKHRVNGTKIVPQGMALEVKIEALGGREYRIHKGGRDYQAFLVSEDAAEKTSTWWINGFTYEVQSLSEIDEKLEAMGVGAKAASGFETLKAPMPGMVLAIPVQEGQAVKKGDTLVVLEAMKMENALKAPHDAVVGAIKAQAGKPVEKGTVLLSFAE
jgi:biotin carboxyl carrier protein